MKTLDKQNFNFNKIVTDAVGVFFKDALKITFTNPSQAIFFAKTLQWQRKAARIRAKWSEQGLQVPPILIFSVTSKCNLHCEGCYHQSLRGNRHGELSEERLRQAVAEAKELGVSFVVFAGGEPLMRPSVLDLAKDHPEIMFLMFTNGLLINHKIIESMAKERNIVPLISLEGYEASTDARRGTGVYKALQNTIAKLKERNLFWGASLTMTRNNFDEVTSEEFVERLVKAGCKLFMLVEYTPVREGTENWVLTEEQKSKVFQIRNALRAKFSALFIALPWDENEIGGCLSAGRGFIHISAEGAVEPCPFVPFSDINLKDIPLKEALQSKLLRAIRENNDSPTENNGCALWEKREWVRSIATPSDPSLPRMASAPASCLQVKKPTTSSI
jgi:MoaA/NifB/PqqE/SkfB family radical SAM enzyme